LERSTVNRSIEFKNKTQKPESQLELVTNYVTVMVYSQIKSTVTYTVVIQLILSHAHSKYRSRRLYAHFWRLK